MLTTKFFNNLFRSSRLLFFSFALILLAFYTSSAEAQELLRDHPGVKFTNPEVAVANSKLEVSFSVAVRRDVIKRDQALMMVPVFTNGVGQEVTLPSILFNGSTRASYYRREQALKSHSDYLKDLPLVTKTLSRDANIQRADYKTVYPIDGAVNGKLAVRIFLIDCCNSVLLEERDLATLGEKRREWSVPHINECLLSPVLKPTKEQVKQRAEQIELYVSYPFDKDEVIESFQGNRAEIEKLKKQIAPLMEKGDIFTLKEASIDGYASPEGKEGYNKDLSKRRAESIKRYLIGIYPNIALFKNATTIGKGADWKGAEATIRRDPDVPNKQALLSAIAIASPEARQEAVTKSAGYNYVLANLYPSLRRSVLEVKYRVRAFNIKETEELLQKRPKDLSVFEIYEVIALYEKSGKGANDLYRIAAETYPADVVAQVNYSGLLLKSGHTDEALATLFRFKDDPRSYNNLGVCYLLKGDRRAAQLYLDKAISAGIDAPLAKQNMKLLEEK